MAQTAVRSKRSTTDSAVRASERITRRKLAAAPADDSKAAATVAGCRVPTARMSGFAGQAVSAPLTGCGAGSASCTLGVPVQAGFSSTPATLPGPVLGWPTYGPSNKAWLPPFPCPPPAFMMFMMQQHMQRMQQFALGMSWPMPGLGQGFNPLALPTAGFPPMPGMHSTPFAAPNLAQQAALASSMPTGNSSLFPLNLQFGSVPSCGKVSLDSVLSSELLSTHTGGGPEVSSSTRDDTLLPECTDAEFHTFISSFLQPATEELMPVTGHAALDLPLDLSELTVNDVPASPQVGGVLLGSLLDTLDRATDGVDDCSLDTL